MIFLILKKIPERSIPLDHLRNLPTDSPQSLAQLLPCKAGQVISMSIFQNDTVQMTLLSFGAGESVSEELYFGDTLYYVLEGSLLLHVNQQEHTLQTGQVLAVPAGQLHALIACEAFKILQITATK